MAIFVLAAFLSASGYVNPLKGDLGVHDPVMIREEATSTYRIYFTGYNVGSKTSSDRITWRSASSGLRAPGWVKEEVPGNSGSDFWAPDIMFRDNKYWLYYSVSVFSKNTSAIGLATSPTLTNPTWTDQGVVVKSSSSDNYNCIDPAIFQDDDGKVWLTFGSYWSGIKLVECDPATGKPPETRPDYISIANHRSGIEAPYLCKWGYYYLFVSWDKCCQGCNSTYKIVVGRATNIKGPYVDKEGTDMLDGGGEIIDAGDDVRKGPGHNGILIDNDTVFCVNHYYACNSILQIRHLYFDDGWPSFTGTVTKAPTVGVTGMVTTMAPHYVPNIRISLTLSCEDISRSGDRIFTITGREITSGPPAGRYRIPQGIVIVDSRR
ncbi:MAG: arabinan endo-1,5-alpha-L-arabinosidase [Chitinispirillaceae bacterium]|nr:arabinan endo-1,5-alpha-L-arabinosidase [Chitinispirillaceae bacterium]